MTSKDQRAKGLKDQRTRGLKGVSFIYDLKGQSAHPLEDRRSEGAPQLFPLRGKGVSCMYDLKGQSAQSHRAKALYHTKASVF
uniref:Uncharacterized protein orf82 n=1 Tax=Monomastix sp. (strain OKE-1) TaxID=141716 RepID=C0JWL9_MONSK|nr:hypothetical protein MoOKC_p035 [Monomastix sp. OKE-1]ACK36921.1 unknown [Monomastix sp. OKE-1]